MDEESLTWNNRIVALCNDTELQVECKPYWNCVVKEQFEQHLASSQT